MIFLKGGRGHLLWRGPEAVFLWLTGMKPNLQTHHLSFGMVNIIVPVGNLETAQQKPYILF